MNAFKYIIRTWLIAIVTTFFSANVLAGVVYTTFPGPAGGGWCLGAGTWTATGVHTPAGSGYTLDSINARIQDASGNGDPFAFDLYNDNGGAPGSLIASIGNGFGHGSGTSDIFTVTPNSPISLSANTTYWIVLSTSSGAGCTLAWADTGSNPAGSIFTYVGEGQYSGGWNRHNNSFQQLEINATGLATPTSIPTLNQWGMILLAGILGVGAIFSLRRQRQ
jgi:hypothetical protein